MMLSAPLEEEPTKKGYSLNVFGKAAMVRDSGGGFVFGGCFFFLIFGALEF